ncbi:VWA domain-containing protein [Myceligenerans cantabricum]
MTGTELTEPTPGRAEPGAAGAASGTAAEAGPAAAGRTADAATDPEAARRWRLVLGRYAAERLDVQDGDQRLESTLRYLYDREYAARGHAAGRGGDGGRQRGGPGSLDGSAPHGVDFSALGWLGEARSLFPRETFERMQVEAVGRYGLSELLGDRETVEAMEPSRELATALLQLRGKLDPAAADGVRRVIERVVEDVVRRLRPRFLTATGGRVDRSRRSMHRVARNFDWKRTLRANLGRVDGDGRMLVQDVRFNARQKRSLTWDVIVLVDQSGSMAASLLYSAVCAGILSGLPGIDVRLVLFDTSVVDMSHLAHDPVSVLLTAQLGGGTDIARAVRFAEGQVSNPSRTVVALVSDFCEGGSVSELLAAVRRLRSSGVTLLGLAALDEAAEPVYDQGTARHLAEAGMEVAALTPERFAEWLGEVLS